MLSIVFDHLPHLSRSEYLRSAGLSEAAGHSIIAAQRGSIFALLPEKGAFSAERQKVLCSSIDVQTQALRVESVQNMRVATGSLLRLDRLALPTYAVNLIFEPTNLPSAEFISAEAHLAATTRNTIISSQFYIVRALRPARPGGSSDPMRASTRTCFRPRTVAVSVLHQGVYGFQERERHIFCPSIRPAGQTQKHKVYIAYNTRSSTIPRRRSCSFTIVSRSSTNASRSCFDGRPGCGITLIFESLDSYLTVQSLGLARIP